MVRFIVLNFLYRILPSIPFLSLLRTYLLLRLADEWEKLADSVAFILGLGKIAARTGDASWISSRLSRGRVFELRGQSDAIVVGGNTVRQDST